MQFRFREYDEEKKQFNLITYCDIEDYDTMFKTLTFMKEHECEYCIEVNTEGIPETLGDNYEIIDIAFCVSKATGEDRLMPCFVADIEKC